MPASPEADPESSSGRRYLLVGIFSAVALLSFSVAGKFFSDRSTLNEMLSMEKQRLEAVEADISKRRELVSDSERREARIGELNQEINEIAQQSSALITEINTLNAYSRDGVLDNELRYLKNKLSEFNDSIADIKERQKRFLPPSAFTEEELQERDASLRGVVPLYLRARERGFMLIQKSLFAPTVMHKESKFRDVSSSKLFNYLEEEWSKNPPVGLDYELLELAYSGNRIELILRRTVGAQGRGAGAQVAYCKEKWWLDEKGKIRRWDEEISSSEKPSASENFRLVKPVRN